MLVNEITAIIKPKKIKGSEHTPYTQITINSKEVKANSLFVALKGSKVDGHQYIPQAVTQGASVIVCEQIPKDVADSCTYIQVSDSHQALGEIATLFYGKPSEQLILVGVTGTNAKTSIATLLFQLFTDLGYCCGLLSTNTVRIGTEEIAATHTTPDAVSLNAHLAKMLKQGCTHVFMEVSSHAIDQKRIAGLRFRGGIFSNLTHDHLEYHGSFMNYLQCKKAFFDQLPPTAFALSNKDDKNGMVMLQNTAAKRLTYATKNAADYSIKILEMDINGMLLLYKGVEFSVALVGAFNAQNLLAVIATAILLGEKEEDILRTLSQINPVRGRAEVIKDKQGVAAVIDYAHTPDAIAKILESLASIVAPQGKIISIIGAGGNRDKEKRPEMTKQALIHSHTVILTSDNPRYEEPGDIIEEMQAGIQTEDRNKILVVEDRAQAIKVAYRMCHPKDLLLIAGKGHESYQEIKGVKYPFDDKEEILKLFKS